jgi:hypothetical protein
MRPSGRITPTQTPSMCTGSSSRYWPSRNVMRIGRTVRLAATNRTSSPCRSNRFSVTVASGSWAATVSPCRNVHLFLSVARSPSNLCAPCVESALSGTKRRSSRATNQPAELGRLTGCRATGTLGAAVRPGTGDGWAPPTKWACLASSYHKEKADGIPACRERHRPGGVSHPR